MEVFSINENDFLGERKEYNQRLCVVKKNEQNIQNNECFVRFLICHFDKYDFTKLVLT